MAGTGDRGRPRRPERMDGGHVARGHHLSVTGESGSRGTPVPEGSPRLGGSAVFRGLRRHAPERWRDLRTVEPVGHRPRPRRPDRRAGAQRLGHARGTQGAVRRPMTVGGQTRPRPRRRRAARGGPMDAAADRAADILHAADRADAMRRRRAARRGDRQGFQDQEAGQGPKEPGSHPTRKPCSRGAFHHVHASTTRLAGRRERQGRGPFRGARGRDWVVRGSSRDAVPGRGCTRTPDGALVSIVRVGRAHSPGRAGAGSRTGPAGAARRGAGGAILPAKTG